MRVEPLVPDVAPPAGLAPSSAGSAFGALVDAAASLFAAADDAETRFAAHRGGLQEMVVARARAGVALQVAASAAQRGAQAVQTLLGMQV